MSNIKLCQNTQGVLAETPLRCTVLKLIFISTFPFLFLFLSLLSSTKVLAEDLPECPLTIITDPSVLYDPQNQRIVTKHGELKSITFQFNMSNTTLLGEQYAFGGYLYIYHDGPALCESLYPMIQGTKLYVNQENRAEILENGISYKFERDFNIVGCGNYFLNPNQTITLTVKYYVGGQAYPICKPVQYTISLPFRECQIVPEGTFNLNSENKKIKINDVIYDGLHNCIQVEITDPYGTKKMVSTLISSDGASIEIPMKRENYSVAGNYTVDVYQGTNLHYGFCENKESRKLCTASVEIAPGNATPKPTQTPTPTPTLTQFCQDCRRAEEAPGGNSCEGLCNTTCPWCLGYVPPGPVADLKPICEQLSDSKHIEDCKICMDEGKIWSAIGCLPTDISGLVRDYIFKYGIGIAGGISFLYFLYGCFLIITSSGNPEKIEEAKQIIVSALSGLILIIFSVFILEVIGVDILKLPDFSK